MVEGRGCVWLKGGGCVVEGREMCGWREGMCGWREGYVWL